MTDHEIEKIIKMHYHGFSEEQWNELKNIFPYCEIIHIVKHILKES